MADIGYDIGISKSAMWRVVHSYRDQRRAADVIDLLKLSLEYEPNAEMTWLELGRAYEANNELDQAKTALETAYKKAVQNSSPHLGIFTDAVDKIHRKLNPE